MLNEGNLRLSDSYNWVSRANLGVTAGPQYHGCKRSLRKGDIRGGFPKRLIPQRPRDAQYTAVPASVLNILLSERAHLKCQLRVIKFKSTLKFKEETDEV